MLEWDEFRFAPPVEPTSAHSREKRESRGRELGQRTGSPRPRGRAELKGDSNSDNFDLALYLKGAAPPARPKIKIERRRGKYPFSILASALSASPTHRFLCSP